MAGTLLAPARLRLPGRRYRPRQQPADPLIGAARRRSLEHLRGLPGEPRPGRFRHREHLTAGALHQRRQLVILRVTRDARDRRAEPPLREIAAGRERLQDVARRRRRQRELLDRQLDDLRQIVLALEKIRAFARMIKASVVRGPLSVE